MPNWIISIIMLMLAIWKIDRLLRYRNHDLFLKEVGGDWLDRSRLAEAVRVFLRIEILFFSSLPIIPAVTYIEFLKPYLWYVFAVIFGPIFVAHLWWLFYYSARRPKA
ncbi:hypothetical protein RO575_02870 [Methylomonas sp. MO1]|uniref:hypothetical protein n=1 Tax=unclassified Methylomonas TaxID=2608980 RepID=UPI00047C2AFC|nr:MULTISPECIES: hypothetical protein [unclassified Methylomonas]MDT4288490.1 hypothetical protein [Methylomonas sp. MO1]